MEVTLDAKKLSELSHVIEDEPHQPAQAPQAHVSEDVKNE
jgi:hypothetical protein